MKRFHGKFKRKLEKIADVMKSDNADPNGSYTGIVTGDGYDAPFRMRTIYNAAGRQIVYLKRYRRI